MILGFFFISVIAVLSGTNGEMGRINITVQEEKNVIIPCSYDNKYTDYQKQWCMESMATCFSQRGLMSVTDSPDQGVFTVTMRSLQSDDSGIYLCAVQSVGEIRAVDNSYNITVIKGSPDLSVRDIMVNGEVGGTVTVQCLYSDKDKYTKKTWCRRNMEKSCLQTWSRTFDRDRTKLHVNNVQRIMTVTLTRLEMKDTDWYWCGVGDLNFPVHITVSHQTQTTRGSTTLTTLTTNMPTTSSTESSAVPSSTDLIPTGARNGTHAQRFTSVSLLKILLPSCGFLLLLLLVVMGTWKLWQMRKRRTRKGNRMDTHHDNEVTYSTAVIKANRPSKASKERQLNDSEVTYSSLVIQHK
ncbi:CMRF35-like molecule 3 isoform X2 [Brienomyrus brachyistius]|uniref:CMRF35-like molecule 3 isoform X2 n=1 Tax=Brienomyrus brachyistius TaxID=42636 RepID=UPI0020B234C4|nr:CMRF35-like molecule 3 isoform X2 [Brienomyrus brachyistius]XP_048868402.1 CMRF35-like molecule 3 isoform X2 [Brienomyrus brachyistius]